MALKSFKQMRVDGELTRADGEKIQFKDLHVEPGFNAPGRTDQDNEDDEGLYQYIVSGGRIPELDVRPREEGGVWIVDGHRRHKQIGRAIDAGVFLPCPRTGKYLIPIKQFSGNDIDRVARIATSNEGKKLSPLQLASVYRRLAAFGLDADAIAAKVNRKAAHVRDTLVLGTANHDVQNMVAAGEVSATIAIKTVRSKGEKAGPALKAEHDKALAMGKTKITAATISPKPASPPSVALDAARWRSLVMMVDWSEVAALRLAHVGSTWQEFELALIELVDGRMLEAA